MTLRTYFVWILLIAVSVHCFQRLQQQTRRPSTTNDSSHQEMESRRNLFPPMTQDQVALQTRQTLEWDSSLTQTKECTCPPEYGSQSDDNEDEDVISNVGEAAFAMLGSLWAQEGSIPTSIIFPNGLNNKNDVWIGGDEHDRLFDKDLTRARIRAVLDGLANHPYAKEGNLDLIASQLLQ